MAIFHMNVRVVSRGIGGGGRGAVSVAAYNAGDKLKDFETGKTISKTGKTEVVYSEIDLCKGAPKEFNDRETLWNAVQKKEVRSDAQLARNLEFSIPKEVTDRNQQIEMIRRYVQEQFVSKGMIADWSIHDKGDGNPHCHCLLTMRGINEKTGDWADYKMRSTYKLDASGNRIPRLDANGNQMVRDRTAQGKGIEKLWERVNIPATPWNSPKNVELWREAWADVCNNELKKLNVDSVDHRSFERQGIDRLPTIHEGWEARQMEKEGLVSDRCQENRRVEVVNHFLGEIESKTDNHNLVHFIIEKVSEIGSKITTIPEMIKAVTKVIAEEIFKFDLIEKIKAIGGIDDGRNDIGADAADRSGVAGKQEYEAERAGTFLGELEAEVKLSAVRGLDSGTERYVDVDGEEGAGDTVRREPDPVDAEEARYEGRVDQGL